MSLLFLHLAPRPPGQRHGLGAKINPGRDSALKRKGRHVWVAGSGGVTTVGLKSTCGGMTCHSRRKPGRQGVRSLSLVRGTEPAGIADHQFLARVAGAAGVRHAFRGGVSRADHGHLRPAPARLPQGRLRYCGLLRGRHAETTATHHNPSRVQPSFAPSPHPDRQSQASRLVQHSYNTPALEDQE